MHTTVYNNNAYSSNCYWWAAFTLVTTFSWYDDALMCHDDDTPNFKNQLACLHSFESIFRSLYLFCHLLVFFASFSFHSQLRTEMILSAKVVCFFFAPSLSRSCFQKSTQHVYINGNCDDNNGLNWKTKTHTKKKKLPAKNAIPSKQTIHKVWHVFYIYITM